MRMRNNRLVVVGLALIVLAVAFFLYFMAVMATKSNDPTQMMTTVGQAAGAVGGIGFVMVIFGMIGRKA
jgi:hypothetical protein